MRIQSSPLDDFLGSIFGNDDDKSVNSKEENNTPIKDDEEITNEMSLSSFQQELAKRSQEEESTNNGDEEEEFDGYALRDCIFAKYGVCFDLEFQRVDSYGFRTVYLVSCYAVHVQ